MFGYGRFICQTNGGNFFYEGWKNNTIQIPDSRRTGEFTEYELNQIMKMDWYTIKPTSASKTHRDKVKDKSSNN